MVKCTTCGHRWRAFQDRHEPEKDVPEDDLIVEGPRGEAPPDDDLEFVTAPVAPVRKAAEKKKPSVLLVVAASAVVVLGLAGGAVVLLRQQIAEMLPATAPLFAAIGLPVNTIGLVFEGVKSKAMLQAGRPVWSVTGSVRNVREEASAAPPIRLSLLDASGKEVATLVADTLKARVPPGAVRYFAITMPDPPAGAEKLEVRFEPPAVHAEPKAAAAAVAGDPAEAQPLAADSPDALHAPEKNEQH